MLHCLAGLDSQLEVKCPAKSRVVELFPQASLCLLLKTIVGPGP